jgi:hypothetical protein
MNLTPHHAKYYAHDLTRRATLGMDRLSTALFDAAVDLNPHQIEAALFALQSPLSNGVILADEVVLERPSRPDSPLPVLGRAPAALAGDLPGFYPQAMGP